ncbi:cysteine-rich motor neuron 1 protein-like [Branchiostoma floridae x Branchiostoma japonicum]
MAPVALLLLIAVGYANSLLLSCPCILEADYTCPEPPSDCELTLDVCRCCHVCARQEGESCGNGHTGCASGLTCVYPGCDSSVQEVVHPDGSVMQLVSSCVFMPWAPGTCQPRAKRQAADAVDTIGDQLTDVISGTTDGCQFGDVIIPVGSTYQPDDCTWCECQAAGDRPMCLAQSCLAPSCSNPVNVPGQCCPECPPDAGCQFGDIVIPVGTNHQLDDCTWCYCAAAGQRPMCAVKDCARPPCANPEHVPGQCCPVCSQVDLLWPWHDLMDG